jgi:UDP-N-acetylmuramoylalanine--D-glutamate ligase
MNSLRDTSVLVVGLGLSGLAMARWCARQGAQVRVADTRAIAPQQAALQAEWPDMPVINGALSAATLGDARVVLLSPGLAPTQTDALVTAARAAGALVGGELDVFAQALADLAHSQAYRPQVLAVTGTNGKTTVTSLTGLLIERSGQTVAMAGNIGPTLLDTLQQGMDAQALPQVWVLELSSFQLDGAQGFEPTAATVLNLSQDHLDWHGSMLAYAQAKARIFGPKGVMVLNRDDAAVMAMMPAPASAKGQITPALLTFGSDRPARAGDFGMESVNGMTWLVRALEVDETRKRRKGEAPELWLQRLMPAEALRIRGRHNASNALAALALASTTGAALGSMLYGLREYRGEPHRVESVAIVNDVEYFDDSKGTNVGATVAALNGLGAERRLVVILGGEGKGQDFGPLAAPVTRYVRAVVLIGRDAQAIAHALSETGVPMESAATLPEAVQRCAVVAQPGDAVLLSPACASLDMFAHYGHRAQVFVEAVAALAEAAGQPLDGGLS